MTVFVFPGQGSQALGMGDGLFNKFPKLVKQADEILGYSIVELCLQDAAGNLNNTAYTQPALYTVSALAYLQHMADHSNAKPNYVLGHSLGEYVALFAAEVFDFATGLRLVQKRGALMAQATGGGMAAVLNMPPAEIINNLAAQDINSIDIANYNTASQTVISGPKVDVERAKPILEEAGARVILLKVSGAFHSRYMKAAADEFASYLAQFQFAAPKVKVISNVSAGLLDVQQVQSSLTQQVNNPVRWLESINYLLAQGEDNFIEMGPGRVLTNMIAAIRKKYNA